MTGPCVAQGFLLPKTVDLADLLAQLQPIQLDLGDKSAEPEDTNNHQRAESACRVRVRGNGIQLLELG